MKFFQLDENQSCSAEERKVEAERSFSAPRDVDLRRAPTVMNEEDPKGNFAMNSHMLYCSSNVFLLNPVFSLKVLNSQGIVAKRQDLSLLMLFRVTKSFGNTQVHIPRDISFRSW